VEDENRRLKQISAELLLENRALKDVIAIVRGRLEAHPTAMLANVPSVPPLSDF
jgi:hypothetical protein